MCLLQLGLPLWVGFCTAQDHVPAVAQDFMWVGFCTAQDIVPAVAQNYMWVGFCTAQDHVPAAAQDFMWVGFCTAQDHVPAAAGLALVQCSHMGKSPAAAVASTCWSPTASAATA